MPYALGFHPYFHVPDAAKKQARVETDATRAFDNVTKEVVEVRGPIDLTRAEVDLHLLNHGSQHATLHRGDDCVVVAADSSFRRWVVWTLSGKDFVCLEPWTSPPNALNTGEDLLVLPAGASKIHTMTISLRG